jgi:lipopolysaccharide/colanic/teichoic acid biosynthesis glycosyltransferase
VVPGVTSAALSIAAAVVSVSHAIATAAAVMPLAGIPAAVTGAAGMSDVLAIAAVTTADGMSLRPALVVLVPALAALAIRLESKGPVLFRQERIGKDGTPFVMYKFRTLRESAPRYSPSTTTRDPRATHVGRVLRMTGFDELPQLINVLMGEMSLVGPRPLPVRDVERIDVQWHKRRFSVKPGVTCLWQVKGRSDVSFNDWVRMDLEYIDQWSLGLDMKILMKTVPVVLMGSGAY